MSEINIVPAETLSPFLPRTKIQYEEAYQIVEKLLERAIYFNGCLLCHLVPVPKGYCYTTLGGRSGVKVRVNRLVVSVVNKRWLGPYELALHECDERRCINPIHLYEGSAQDNTDDMIARGRKVDDPEVGRRRKEGTAGIIFPLYKQGMSDDNIANILGLSKSTVVKYTRGEYRSFISVLAGD